MKIIQEKNNELFMRKEIKLVSEFEKSPSYSEAVEFLSKELDLDKELMAVKLIKGRFGSKEFFIEANIYKNKESKEALEPKIKSKNEAENKTENKAGVKG